MSATSPKFSKVYPTVPTAANFSVYRCSFPWAGAVDCYVRKNGSYWETAEVPVGGYSNAEFTACPVAGASETRLAAVMAFDYHHGTYVGARRP